MRDDPSPIAVRNGRILNGHHRALEAMRFEGRFRAVDVETGEEFWATLAPDVLRALPDDQTRENPPSREELTDALALLCAAFSGEVRRREGDPTKIATYTHALDLLARDMPTTKKEKNRR